MLTCIACTTNNDGSKKEEQEDRTPKSKQTIKSLTSHIKDMYKSCKPCSGSSNRDSNSGRFHYSYKRATGSGGSTPKILGKEMESRLKGLLSGEGTPESMSSRRTESTVFMDNDNEAKEWVAQVEHGVLITFVSLAEGGNDLKRIRFSREMFDKWEAQKWWVENFDKVMELYNVQKFNQQSVPLPTPPRTEDESSRSRDTKNCPATPPLNKECPRGTSGIKTETTSVDGNSSKEEEEEEEEEEADDDHSAVSVSNASENETEWVEQDEAGVYITIRTLPDGTRELRRVRFSREMFGEMNARLWWEQNRARIQQQYL